MPAVHVLVPVKALGLAKTRMAPAFAPEDRSELVLAMLADTVDAARAVDDATVTVITSDPQAAELAQVHGARVLPDPPGHGRGDGLNTALRFAAQRVRSRTPAVDLVAVHADLPSVRTEEISEALVQARRAGRAIVADHTGDGTAALLHCLPDRPFAPSFGADSARRHVDAGAIPVEGALPGLRLDVDTVADLDAAIRLGVGPSTAEVLARWMRAGFALDGEAATFLPQ